MKLALFLFALAGLSLEQSISTNSLINLRGGTGQPTSPTLTSSTSTTSTAPVIRTTTPTTQTVITPVSISNNQLIGLRYVTTYMKPQSTLGVASSQAGSTAGTAVTTGKATNTAPTGFQSAAQLTVLKGGQTLNLTP